MSPKERKTYAEEAKRLIDRIEGSDGLGTRTLNVKRYNDIPFDWVKTVLEPALKETVENEDFRKIVEETMEMTDDRLYSHWYDWLDWQREYLLEVIENSGDDITCSPSWWDRVVGTKIRAGEDTGYPAIDSERTAKGKHLAYMRLVASDEDLQKGFMMIDAPRFSGRSGGWFHWRVYYAMEELEDLETMADDEDIDRQYVIQTLNEVKDDLRCLEMAESWIERYNEGLDYSDELKDWITMEIEDTVKILLNGED